MTMTTLLERPTILAVGKPPNTFQGDAPAPPDESDAVEFRDDEDDEAEEV
jgi:hypothetical protein